MRDNDGRQALVALVAGIAVMAVAVGAFVALAGDNKRGSDAPAEEPAGLAETSHPTPAHEAEADPPRPPLNCVAADACRQPSLELLAVAGLDASTCDGSGLRVCLVPLGEVPADLVLHLADYYRAQYELDLRLLPSVPLEGGFDRGRQLEIGTLYKRLWSTYPEQYVNPDVILIGLTSIDIYTEENPEWGWFFGAIYNAPEGGHPRHAIISAFRMDPVNWGEKRDDKLRNRRVRTLMNKYVGRTYFHLPLNDNPRSVMYRQISSLGTLDRIDERIPSGR